jgi:hypothetical protein
MYIFTSRLGDIVFAQLSLYAYLHTGLKDEKQCVPSTEVPRLAIVNQKRMLMNTKGLTSGLL